MAGRGRGRGGFGGYGAPGMIKGATWDYDPELKLESEPTDLFPPHPHLKRPPPLSEREKRQVKYFKDLQTQIHRGPLYTRPTKRDPDGSAKTFDEAQFNSQYGTNKKADFDPFLDGVETYSSRFAPPKNEIPQLSGRPFNQDFFPPELWGTLEGEEGGNVRNHINRAMQKKSLLLSGPADPTQRTQIILEKIHRVAGDEEENDDVEERDHVEDQAEVDDEFDDEDLGGDYDAEKYFDDGDGDGEDERGGDENDF